MVRHVAALALVAMVATACSDDDDTVAARSTTTTTTIQVPTFTGDSDSEFCQATRAAADLPPVDPFAEGLEPTDVRIAMRDLVTRIETLYAVSPPEIVDDLATLLVGLQALDDALRDVGYDLLEGSAAGVDPSAFDDDAFTIAGARVGAYQTQVCGV